MKRTLVSSSETVRKDQGRSKPRMFRFSSGMTIARSQRMRHLITLWLIALAVQPPSTRAPGSTPDISSPSLRISFAEFKKLYDAKQVVVIDVRDEHDYADGHIAGARNMPFATIERQAAALKKSRLPIVLYCG